MKRLLLVTAPKDPSATRLVEAGERHAMIVDTASYHDRYKAGAIYDFIYFRNPFSDDSLDEKMITDFVMTAVSSNPKAHFIDGVSSYDALLFEDKWRQFGVFSDLMPPTKLLKDKALLKDGKSIAKQRLSSTEEGIAFEPQQVDDTQEYVVQPRLSITKEYRVYGIHQGIISPAAIRSSKTPTSRVKIQTVEKMSDNLLAFAKAVYDRIPLLQFVGMDIVETTDGTLALLEVNRSPQFVRYDEVAGTSLADEFMKGLQ